MIDVHVRLVQFERKLESNHLVHTNTAFPLTGFKGRMVPTGYVRSSNRLVAQPNARMNRVAWIFRGQPTNVVTLDLRNIWQCRLEILLAKLFHPFIV